MNKGKTLRRPWDKKTKFPSLMTYVKEDDLKVILNSKSDQIEFCEYIFHDKDPKVPHYHVVLSLKKPRYVSEIIGWFARCIDDSGNLVNTMGKPTRSCSDMDDYLTHKNDSTKHQYSEYDIKVLIGNRAEYREMQTEYQVLEEKEAQKAFEKEALANEVEQLLQDCIDGVPFREMARRYGRDFIKNVQSYRTYAGLMLAEEDGDFQIVMELLGDSTDAIMAQRDNANIRYGEYTVRSAVARWATLVKDSDLSTGGAGVVTALCESLLAFIDNPKVGSFPTENKKI